MTKMCYVKHSTLVSLSPICLGFVISANYYFSVCVLRCIYNLVFYSLLRFNNCTLDRDRAPATKLFLCQCIDIILEDGRMSYYSKETWEHEMYQR